MCSFALLRKQEIFPKMSEFTSAVTKAVDTHARKATFGEAALQTAGLENNKRSAETIIILADIKGINTKFGRYN